MNNDELTTLICDTRFLIYKFKSQAIFFANESHKELQITNAIQELNKCQDIINDLRNKLIILKHEVKARNNDNDN